MNRIWDDEQNCLITLLAEEISPLAQVAEGWINAFSQRYVLVGVVSPLPEARLKRYFESEHSNPSAVRMMSGKGHVYKGWDHRLHILSWLPGCNSPVEYVPTEDEDVIIGDLPLTAVNLRIFLTLLKYHRPLPYRRSRLAAARCL